eukprot:3166724-Pyramimonas_sp.AAC.1
MHNGGGAAQRSAVVSVLRPAEVWWEGAVLRRSKSCSLSLSLDGGGAANRATVATSLHRLRVQLSAALC